MTLELIEEHRCFGGNQLIYSHYSEQTHCKMRFAIFLPPQANHQKVPLLYWLSGLGCDEQNFINKSGAQRLAATLGLALVCPDTSPRGVQLPGDRDSFDLGIGAGFYVDATQKPWSQHYRMSSYITAELLSLIEQNFPVDQQRTGIFGHSMGGHGALILALKNPELFLSVSAFAPLSSAMQAPWGQKALNTYLGMEKSAWKAYDACELIKSKGWPHAALLIDQGTADPFLKEQLKPELLEQACTKAGIDSRLRMQQGYDHSYFFIASFIDDHLRFHAKQLGAKI
ncbi:MAG: S-formylglutathione hydrolase [Tatlockia sp.]|nr:S-formylglutathione hydrolase [Tatlockia sp.]